LLGAVNKIDSTLLRECLERGDQLARGHVDLPALVRECGRAEAQEAG
jgi:hypothetical protein